MPKRTVRLSIEASEGFDYHCQVNGISFGAFLEAACEELELHNHKGPVEDWPEDDPYRETQIRVIRRAREIDGLRRSRRQP